MFKEFAEVVRKNYEEMAQAGELYAVENSNDILWTSYLSFFPEGTNDIFRERTYHDCNCCKQFIRRLGCVVSIKDSQMKSVWDIDFDGHPYSVVAKRLSELVHSLPVVQVFRTSEHKYGHHSNVDNHDTDIVWYHFEGKVFPRHHSRRPGEDIGQFHSTRSVFQRGLDELSLDALNTITEIIEADATAIYRGQEHLSSLKAFRELKLAYDQCENKKLFAWEHIHNRSARFKNTVIGTLIEDMSQGKSLEESVKAFEKKVAPSNYKRPKALVTERMVNDAIAKIDELNLRHAVERRHATIADVSVNDIIFVDHSEEHKMKDSLASALMTQVKRKPIDETNVRSITMEQFLQDIVPKVETMEVLVENKHLSNLVSITAPMSDDEEKLFSWNNNFAWSYKGNFADSDIKARVKKAGGNVSAPFRVSLAWFNYDDLDIHAIEPDGNHIYYGNKSGKLDVDMNAGGGSSREAVENICWTKPKDGVYQIRVRNYSRRESIDVGFDLEVENNGNIRQYHYSKPVGHQNTVTALAITLKNGEIESIGVHNDLEERSSSKEEWGIQTQNFVKVKTLMKSPNHWHGEQKGNAHWFFILDNCLNPEPVRGMYNEQLRADLHDHRKVFEILAGKMMVQPSEEQLSGLGFSSTKQAEFVVKVRGDVNSVYKIQI